MSILPEFIGKLHPNQLEGQSHRNLFIVIVMQKVMQVLIKSVVRDQRREIVDATIPIVHTSGSISSA